MSGAAGKPVDAKALLAVARQSVVGGGQTEVRCPACESPGLSVIDKSARPHAEWYDISCANCGLHETLNIPLSGRSGQGY